MYKQKLDRKVKKIILRVLGIITIAQLFSLLIFYNRYLLSSSINTINAYLIKIAKLDSGNKMFYIALGIFFILIAPFVISVIQLMDTTSSSKWRKRIRTAYNKILIFSVVSVIYMTAVIVIPDKYKYMRFNQMELITAICLLISYILLTIFIIYKKKYYVEKMFDPVNFVLVAAFIFQVLGGGILCPAKNMLYPILISFAQGIPILFLIYFEFCYMKVLLTRDRYKNA